MRRREKIHEIGEALVSLLFFMIIAITVVSAAVGVSVVNTQNTHSLHQSVTTLEVAESGAEEALLRLVRDPEYAGGVFPVGGATATITVVGDEDKIITSMAQLGGFTRSVEVRARYEDNILSIISWKEIF